MKDSPTAGELEQALSSDYVIDREPTGRCFIFPDGKFLHLDRGRSHIRVEYWLIEHGLAAEDEHSRDGGSPTLQGLGVIRAHMDEEGFIMLNGLEPTAQQYESLSELLFRYMDRKYTGFWADGRSLTLMTASGDGQKMLEYPAGQYTPDDIIHIIRHYYSTGILYESRGKR